MPRNQRDYSDNYYNSNENRARNGGGRYRNSYESTSREAGYGPRKRDPRNDEFDQGNEDYDQEMRYGRSGLARAQDYDDRDYNTGYRSGSVYDEDDYDSDYGSSRDYSDRTFGSRRRDEESEYDTSPRRDYGRFGGQYQREDNRRGVSDYGRGSSNDDRSESADFRRRYSNNYRNDY